MNLKNFIIKHLIKFSPDNNDFRPVIAEFEDAPQNPLAHFVFWSIIFLGVFTAAWMYFTSVDIVISARGIVFPKGEVIQIQSAQTGILKQLYVHEGDKVFKGDILAVITPNEHEPEFELINMQQEENMVIQQIQQTSTKLRYARDRIDRLSDVQDLITAQEFDSAKQESIILEHELSRQKLLLNEIRNKSKQIKSTRLELKAPVDGIVYNINIHTIGQNISTTQNLLSIVPDNANLLIKAKVKNDDIGFIHSGQLVSIKVDAFDFQKYGVIDGFVIFVAPNSIFDEKNGFVYEVYIKPIHNYLPNEHNLILKIGMTTNNEFIIGKRKIIEFFIYPLTKNLDVSLKVK